jgi:hypothetical protein
LAFRKYEDSGVFIQIVKYDGINIQRRCGGLLLPGAALGANAISAKSRQPDQRLGAFAAKHQMMVGYQVTATLPTPKLWRLGAWAGFHLFEV